MEAVETIMAMLLPLMACRLWTESLPIHGIRSTPTLRIIRLNFSVSMKATVRPHLTSPPALVTNDPPGLSTIWPFLTPSSPSGSGIAANSTWFPLSLTDSTLFTAFLFSSMSHKCIRWRNRSIPDGAFKPPDFRALQMIEIEAINLINKAIQDPSRAASDAVILSVLCMAHNPTYCSPQNVSPSTPFAAPLQRLQWLEVFGNSAPNIVHVRGLMQMIMLRGGVEKIELPGLASILSL